ncbi:beta-propeller fold lactonase family protein [Leptospira sp. 'Mane']|uniref:beta-propeller fold lactonase family protein n=1 Tax=Leptospira sp. 'Mane' TaxID=3387407 RepID=UPI00398B1387
MMRSLYSRTYILLCLIILSANCNAFFKEFKFKPNSLFVLFFGGSTTSPNGEVTLPLPVLASTEPTLSMFGSSLAGLEKSFQSTVSSVPAPASVSGNYVPIGKVYDLGLNFDNITGITKEDFYTIRFNNPVELHYGYDPKLLKEGGFIEEFMVYYFDQASKSWKPVEGIRVDYEKHEVVALTSHFTPFVLTASPIPVGTGVVNPPSCVTNEFPITGTGAARWTVVDTNFKYLKDRNYTIDPTPDFYALGFERSLAIATCNGGAPAAGTTACGNFIDHKINSLPNYIQFTAPRNIDVYIMYDNRGPVDAPWLATEGWVDTGSQIETTDDVPFYKVYKKSFASGAAVTLHGNTYGIAGVTNINTNYWVVVKTAGVNVKESPGSFCATPPVEVVSISSAFGIPGSDRATLFWKLPNDPNVTNVLIRRQINFPTLNPSEGVSPLGSELSSEAYLDIGLIPGQNYFYTLFTLDADGLYSPGKVVAVTTGTDMDGDGISDIYENDPTHVYDSGLPANSSLADTDGDGISDWQEIVDGTDPTNPDATKPVISQFLRTSGSPTSYPLFEYDLQASDNVAITGWIVRESSITPKKDDADWAAVKPVNYLLDDMRTYNLYAWAKDAAGNISNPVPLISTQLNGLKYPKFVYVSDRDSRVIKIYKQNLITGNLDSIGSISSPYAVNQLYMHPSGKFLLTTNAQEPYLSSFQLNQGSGQLTLVEHEVTVDTVLKAGIHPGSFITVILVPSASTRCGIQSFGINSNSGSLSLEYQMGHPQIPPCIDLAVHPSGNWLNLPMAGSIVTVNSPLNSLSNNAQSISIQRQIDHPNGAWTYWISGSEIHYANIDLNNGVPYSRNANISASGTILDMVIQQNGESAYLLYSNGAGTSVQLFSINPSNGGLTLSGSILLHSGQQSSGHLELESTSNYLYATDGGSKKTYNIRLNASNGNILSIRTNNNTGWYSESLSVNNTNEAPIVSPWSMSKIGIYRGGLNFEYPFGHVTQKASNTIFGWSNEAALVSQVRDGDLLRCNPNQTNYSDSLSLTDPNSNLVSPERYTGNKTNRYLRFIPKLYGDYTLTYSFTDDPGTCLGGAKTSTRTDIISTRNIKYHSSQYIGAGQFPAETSTKKFSIEWINSNGYFLPQLYESARCTFVYRACGIVGDPWDPYNPDKIRYTCEDKEEAAREVIERVSYGQSINCESKLPAINPWDSFVAGKRVKKVSSQILWKGNYVEIQ